MSDSMDLSVARVPNSLTVSDTETGRKGGDRGLRSEGTVVQSLLNFSEATTFHGYRFVFRRDTHILRRLLWLILVLTALVFLCYQITDRATHYYEWPVTTSSQIMNNGTMRFPAVTICNLNAFKISQVQKNMYMDIVNNLSSGEESRRRRARSIPDIHVKAKSIFNTPMDEVIENTRHEQSDLIVQCSWISNVCSYVNFSKILTESGVCYTFNGRGTGNELITADAGEGLQLVLNIETYEYMVGQNPGAGVKIIIHEKNEYPSVVGGGQMVSPDSDTRVNMKYTEYVYLGEPYGRCEKTLLRYMNYSYSVAACRLECLSDYTNHACGCVDPYMPGPYPKCEASRSLLCVANIRNSPESHNVICSCPPPCVEYRYTPTSSYSSLSDFTVDVMEEQLNVSEIQTDVNTASHSRLLARHNLIEAFNVERARSKSAVGSFENETSFLLPYIANAKILIPQLKESCYDRVSYSLEKLSLLKPIWNKFRELLVECHELNDHGISSVLILHQLIIAKQFHNINDRLIRIAQNNIISSLQERDSVLVKVNNAYTKRVQNLLSEQPWIDIPINLNNNVGKILNISERIMKLLENIFTLDSEQEIELLELINMHRRTLRTTCANLMTAESVISTEVLDLENMKLMAPVCFTILTKAYHYSENLNTAFDHLYSHFNKIKEGFDKLSEMSFLLENLTSHEAIREIQWYLENVVYELPFDNLLTAIDHWTVTMIVAARELLHDVDSVFFSINQHMSSDIDEIMETFTPVHFSQHGEAMAISVTSMKEIYMRWMKVFRTTMDKMTIDAKFYRKNFIHLHISYHEMTYRKIIQRPSYDIVALMSDIGGNMGLLVGGSVISLFEVFDMIFIVTCIFFNSKHYAPHRIPQTEEQRT